MSPHKKRAAENLQPSSSISQPSTLINDSMMHDCCDQGPVSCPSMPTTTGSLDKAHHPTVASSPASPPPMIAVVSMSPKRSPASSPVLEARRRERFLIFMKILFTALNEQDPQLHARAKRVVVECTRKNRMGDPEYEPLMAAVQDRLRTMVGESQWRKASCYLHHYYQTKKQQGSKEVAPKKAAVSA